MIPPAGVVVCNQANVTPDDLIRRDPTIVDRARPHVQAVRGLTVDEAQLYAIEHGVTQQTLMVAEALAAELDQALRRARACS